MLVYVIRASTAITGDYMTILSHLPIGGQENDVTDHLDMTHRPDFPHLDAASEADTIAPWHV